MMFATRGKSPIYHLVDADTGKTVCGHRARAGRLARKMSGVPLQQTPTRPLDKIACKHCVRLSEPKIPVTQVLAESVLRNR